MAHLKHNKEAIDLKLPETDFDFPTQSLLDWHQKLNNEITHLPHTGAMNANSVKQISTFYI